jgi:SAM-dependent methyltransferase
MGSFNRFGFEWSKYPQIIPLYEKQFLGWVAPLRPDDFRGKRVLDGGCGTGRNSWWPLQYGAAQVTAFDVDPRTVAVAAKNLANVPNATVLERSIYDIEFSNEFDIAFSIGVIHHLADPRRAVARLVEAVRPGGTVLIWVYGKEGYAWAKNFINVLRKVTSRMPLGLLRWMTYPFSLLFYLYIKCLPHRHPYLKLLRPASFWHLHSIVFDQLLPEIANYWTAEDAKALFDGLPVEDVMAYDCNAGSWTVIARKKK